MSLKPDIILFDLDGTLIDSKEGVTKSVQHALKHFGIVEEDTEKFRRFIGPPLQESFREFYGFDGEDNKKILEIYREKYSTEGKFQNNMYPGMMELLAKLKESGKILAVATSKYEGYAVEILKHIDMFKYFDFVGGSSYDTSRITKTDVIKYVLESLNLKPSKNIFMVGDRKFDINSAKEVGITSVAIMHGYASKEEMDICKPEFLVDDVSGLSTVLL